jgi:hypothetical protein
MCQPASLCPFGTFLKPSQNIDIFSNTLQILNQIRRITAAVVRQTYEHPTPHQLQSYTG